MANENQLFFLEFFIDKVTIPVIRAVHNELLPSTTCVSFQVLSLPHINICQKTPGDCCSSTSSEGDTQIFKKGKSCLFALPLSVLKKPLASFPINMSVYKQLPPGVLPDVMSIGCHKIEIKELINSLLSQFDFESDNNKNPSKTLKDIFTITTPTGQCVGSVTVFIRASCFGNKIVTQFQLPHNRKPYLFKGMDDSPIFQCKRVPSRLPTRCLCSPDKSNDGSGETAKRNCLSAPVPVSGDAGWGGPQSCCPSTAPRRESKGFTGCPPCCLPPQHTASKPAPISRGYKKFGDLLGKETALRKCGCPVKDHN